ncbi:MAG: hypothetical protein OXR73_33755 [Myxococcales bacterium]|nr:hypothetical protein [Myxococcales bacterium]
MVAERENRHGEARRAVGGRGWRAGIALSAMGLSLAATLLYLEGSQRVAIGSIESQGGEFGESTQLASAGRVTRQRHEYGADGQAVMPGGQGAPGLSEPMHPHPITATHERIFRENNLVGALNAAVDFADASRIRQTLQVYRAEYPEDTYVLQEGYEIIAACLDDPSAATRARAEAFWNTQIRSQTRRYVRRYCLAPKRAASTESE